MGQLNEKIEKFAEITVTLVNRWIHGGPSTIHGDTIKTPDSQLTVNSPYKIIDDKESFYDNVETETGGYRDEAITFRDEAETAGDNIDAVDVTPKADKFGTAVGGEVVTFDGTGNIDDSGEIAVNLHAQNTDTKLDEGGPNEVTAVNLATAISNTHVQDTDTGLDIGGTNPVQAIDLVNFRDNVSPNIAEKDAANTFTGDNEFTGDLTQNGIDVYTKADGGEGSGIDADTLRGVESPDKALGFTKAEPDRKDSLYMHHNYGFLVRKESQKRAFVAGNGVNAGLGVNAGNREQLCPLHAGDVTKIYKTSYGGFLLTSAGDVYSFGYNDQGNLGHTDTDVQYPTKISGFTAAITHIYAPDVVAYTNFEERSIFLDENGEVWNVGHNHASYNPFGESSPTYGSRTSVAKTDFGGAAVVTPVRWIAGSIFSSALIDDNYDLWVIGRNDVGQLGLGDTTDRTSAYIKVTKPTGVTEFHEAYCTRGSTTGSVELNYNMFVLCKKSDNSFSLYGCGDGNNGQLGQGNTNDSSSLVEILTNVVDFAIGSNGYPSIWALDDNDDLYVWGYNADGQLGMGDTTTRNSPVINTTFTNHASTNSTSISKIIPYGDRGPAGAVAVVYANGDCLYAGHNTTGAAGTNDLTDISTPKQVILDDNIVDVAFMGEYNYTKAYYFTDTGEIYCAGKGTNGEMGIFGSDEVSYPIPQKVYVA